jgi:hypothetical protein
MHAMAKIGKRARRCEHDYPLCVLTRFRRPPGKSAKFVEAEWDCILCGPYCTIGHVGRLPEVRPLAYLLRETEPGTWIYVDAVKRIVTTSEPPRRRKVAGR